MTSSPRQCQLFPCPQTTCPGILEKDEEHWSRSPSACSLSQPWPQLPRLSFRSLYLPGSVTMVENKPSNPVLLLPRAHEQLLTPPPRPRAWQGPHLSPGLRAPGCAALQVASLCGRRLPRQTRTVSVLDGLLDASPVRPDTVDRADLGATSTGGRAGCPGPGLPAGRKQEPGIHEAGKTAGANAQPEGAPALTQE